MNLKYLPQGERYLSGKITASLNTTDTTVAVDTPPSATKLPMYMEFEPDSSSNREEVRVVKVSGSIITMERGIDNGGVGKNHQNNSTYKQKVTAKHWSAVVDAIESGYLLEDTLRTLTRASSTQFTIAGYGASDDLTSMYTKGRIIRFNGDDTKLAIVKSSSYSSNTTTVNVTSGTVPSPLTTAELAIMPRAGMALSSLYNIQDGQPTYAADSGAADAYALTLAPAPTAYLEGQTFRFKALNANATTTPTLNVNSLGTKTIKHIGGAALVAGDIAANQEVMVIYDGTDFLLLTTHAGLVTKTGTQTLTGKTISGASNTLTVREADLSIADNTTANVSTSAHGFVPKAPNDTSKFLRGDATWAAPAGSSGGTLQSLQTNDTVAISNNNTTTYATAMAITFTPSAVADLIITGFINWYGTSGEQGKSRITLDGTALGTDPQAYTDFPATNKAFQVTYQEFATSVSAASHTVALQFAQNTGSSGVNINVAGLRIAVFNH